MDFLCPACRRAGYPPVLEAAVPAGRCQACGARLAVPPDGVTEEGRAPPPPPFSRDGARLLRCQGHTWRIAGDEVLRRWIVEHRIAAWDLVSHDGVRWEPLDRQPALCDLMNVVERLDGSRAARPAGLKEASDPEAGWTAAMEPEGSAPAPRS